MKLKEISLNTMHDLLKSCEGDVVAVRYDQKGNKKDNEMLHSLADLETWESVKSNVWDYDKYFIKEN